MFSNIRDHNFPLLSHTVLQKREVLDMNNTETQLHQGRNRKYSRC